MNTLIRTLGNQRKAYRLHRSGGGYAALWRFGGTIFTVGHVYRMKMDDGSRKWLGALRSTDWDRHTAPCERPVDALDQLVPLHQAQLRRERLNQAAPVLFQALVDLMRQDSPEHWRAANDAVFLAEEGYSAT